MMSRVQPLQTGKKRLNARTFFHFCDAACAAQAREPVIHRETMDDFAAFCKVRHLVTTHRLEGDTPHAIAAARGVCGDEREREWCDALLFGYEQKCERVYSIAYWRDPSVTTFLDTVELALAKGDFHQAAFDMLVMGVRCNKVMATALRHDLLLSRRLAPGEVKDILNRPGVMSSCTKLGNCSVEEGRVHIRDLYSIMSEENLFGHDKVHDRHPSQDAVADVLAALLQGRLEFTVGLGAIRQRYPFLYGLGDFKKYFVGKCLRSRFPQVNVRTVVGTNLAPDRDSGAFNALFQTPLAANLAKTTLAALLDIVTKSLADSLARRGDALLRFVVDADVAEHACCEYIKARWVRGSYRLSVKAAVLADVATASRKRKAT